MTNYTIIDDGKRWESDLEGAQEWLLRRVWHQTCLPPFTTFDQWLTTLDANFEGITAQEVWATIPEDRRLEEVQALEKRQAEFLHTFALALGASESALQRREEPAEPTTETFMYKGKEYTVPSSSFNAAIDKIAYLAWKAAHLHMPATFNWMGQEIEIPVTEFEYPNRLASCTLCSHMQGYGLLEDFEFEWPKEHYDVILMTNEEITSYMKLAKAEGKLLYEWLDSKNLPARKEWFAPNSSGWGGARPNAGRKGNRTSGVSARVPEAILEKLKAEAEADGISVSAKVAEILANWAKRHK